MITLKLDIEIDDETKGVILEHQCQYSNLLHIFYNRLQDKFTHIQCKKLKLNNLDLMNSWFRQSCVYEADGLIKRFKDKNIIFGGKALFKQRNKGLISKEEFREKRLSALCSIGEARCFGNRLFRFNEECDLFFKPNRKESYEIKIKNSSKKIKRYLELLYQHQILKDIPITYKLTTKNVYISFDEKILKKEFKQFKPIKDRIMSIDMNPNYVGYSVIDWIDSEKFKIIDKGVISLKSLNNYENSLSVSSESKKSKYITNKRRFETLEVVNFLKDKMVHFRCEMFAIEDLSIKNKYREKSRKFNKLVNKQWNRLLFINCLEKWCNIFDVKLLKVKPQYSSFIGNLVYRDLRLPDMILSSIEISRRSYEFYHQYIKKDKTKKKNIILIELTDSVKDNIKRSLEELDNVVEFDNLVKLFNSLKKSKCRYKFPLVDNNQLKSFSPFSLKFKQIVV